MKNLIIIAMLTVFPVQAFAAEAILPIKASIVQCGAQAQLEKACRQDSRCCVFTDTLEVAMNDQGGQTFAASPDMPRFGTWQRGKTVMVDGALSIE